MWEREEEYKAELEQVIQKAGTSRLERLASLALEDERTCYKHVMVILEKQYRKCGPNMRGKLHLLYCVSTLLRQSKKQQGARDRYAERLQPLTSALVTDLSLDFMVQVDKLLKLWRMEGVFSVEQIVEVQSGRAGVALRLGRQPKSPSGSLTDTSAQDPLAGLGDASGSGRSSVILSYPRVGPGRTQATVLGAVLLHQQPQQTEGQDPYSADSNPNGIRGAPPSQQPTTLPPPPPPSLIPPGLLGPVGPPGMLSQGPSAAAAGLFPQGQLGGFLGTAPTGLIQQGVYMAPMGHFGAPLGTAIPGAMGPGMGVGVGSSVAGGIGGSVPFPGPPGPMPPGLGFERPPPYPPPPMYNSQSQNQGSRGASYGRFSQTNGGRIPPGLGSSNGPRSTANHQGWQGRYGQEGHGMMSQPVPPPPPRPPPGSPPHGADSRGSGTAAHVNAVATATAPAATGAHKSSGVAGSGTLLQPGLGPTPAADAGAGSGGGSTSSTYGGSGTGYIRPNGRRSRWELERDSTDASAMTAMTGGLLPSGTGPVSKRPVLAVEGGASARLHAPGKASAKPSMPVPSVLPSSTKAEPSAPFGAGMSGGSAISASAIAAADISMNQVERSQHQQELELAALLHSVEQQTRSHTALNNVSIPMEISTMEEQPCDQGTEDVAVADGKADPDGATDQPEERVGPGIEVISGRQHEEQEGLVAARKPGVGTVDVLMQPVLLEAVGEFIDMDDGGSSSAEAVCPAAQHQDSTAPASPGRLSGAAEQGESPEADAAGSHEGRGVLRQDEQQQRRGSSSGGGECSYNRLPVMVMPEVQVVDGAQVEEQQRREHAAENAKVAEAVMSTNQPLLVEQCDAQQRTSNDVQSAEQPSAAQQRREDPEFHTIGHTAVQSAQVGMHPDASQPGMAAIATLCAEQRAGTLNVALPGTGTAVVSQAVDTSKLPESQKLLAQPTASDATAPTNTGPVAQMPEVVSSAGGFASEPLQPTAGSEAAAPKSGFLPSVVPKAVETQPSAPAPGPEQPPQHQASLHSSTLLLSSYADSRVPLQLEELELGDLDESWLE